MFYLDNHTSTKPCQAALDRMQPYLQEHWLSPLSPHKASLEILSSIEDRSFMILDLVGAEPPDQFFFSSSRKEAVDLIFSSVFFEVAKKEGRVHFILSEREDFDTLNAAKKLEELGCTLKILPTRRGRVDLDLLLETIGPKTALVSLSMADPLSGVIQPLEGVFEACQKKGALLHLDASYSMGKYSFDFHADYMSFSGHLIHSVAGSAGVFVKEKAPFLQKTQKASFDVASFMALSAAAQQSLLYVDTMVLEGARLRDLFESQVQAEVLDRDLLRLPNTSFLHFKNVHHEALCYFLSRQGVLANMGGFLGPKHHDECALSFSLSRMSTEEEILKAAEIINTTLAELRALSEVF